MKQFVIALSIALLCCPLVQVCQQPKAEPKALAQSHDNWLLYDESFPFKDILWKTSAFQAISQVRAKQIKRLKAEKKCFQEGLENSKEQRLAFKFMAKVRGRQIAGLKVEGQLTQTELKQLRDELDKTKDQRDNERRAGKECDEQLQAKYRQQSETHAQLMSLQQEKASLQARFNKMQEEAQQVEARAKQLQAQLAAAKQKNNESLTYIVKNIVRLENPVQANEFNYSPYGSRSLAQDSTYWRAQLPVFGINAGTKFDILKQAIDTQERAYLKSRGVQPFQAQQIRKYFGWFPKAAYGKGTGFDSWYRSWTRTQGNFGIRHTYQNGHGVTIAKDMMKSINLAQAIQSQEQAQKAKAAH